MDKFLFPIIIALCSESDIFSNTVDTLTEIEWNPATKLLSQVILMYFAEHYAFTLFKTHLLLVFIVVVTHF